MKYLFDTSVLLAAMVAGHKHHDRAKTWLSKAHQGKFSLYVCNHTLAELYSVLTKLPISPRISPATAVMLIEHNIIKRAKLVNLTSKDYHQVIKNLAAEDFKGGITYDNLIYHAAVKSGVTKLLTFNTKDFDCFNREKKVIIVSALTTSTLH